MTSIRVYLIIATCMTGLSVGGNTARAQSRASLTTDPGAGATLTAEIDVVLATGPVSDTDTQTTNVTGSSVATLLPTDPPFDHAIVHTLDVVGSPVTFDFCLIEFIGCLSGLQVTITDLNIVLLERTDGPIAANGDTTLPDTALAATGTAQVVGTGLLAGQVNETIPVNATTNGTLLASITESGGTVTLAGIQLDPVTLTVPPEDLPAEVLAATVMVSFDTSALTLSGPLSAAILGDADADGDIDLADHADFVECLTGPTGNATPPCTLVDLDADGDVDLGDFRDFQRLLPTP
jgi:hypothetical protein